MNRLPGPVGWAKLFKVAFKRSDNPMLLLNRDRIVIAVNPAFSARAGYPPDEVVGRSALNFIPPDQQPRADEEWARVLRTGSLTFERSWLHRNGSRIDVEVAAHVVKIEAQDVVLVVVMERSPTDADPSGPGARRQHGPVTQRELQVLTRIAMGERLPEVAKALYISPATVRTHVRNLMEKLGAHSQAQLVAIAFAESLLDPAHLDSEDLAEPN
jgi:PAS domain S-box-containing protein